MTREVPVIYTISIDHFPRLLEVRIYQENKAGVGSQVVSVLQKAVPLKAYKYARTRA